MRASYTSDAVTNNKYWVRLQGTNKFHKEALIVAGADEPKEDRSKTICTLSEPIYELLESYYEGDSLSFSLDIKVLSLQFRHVQLGSYGCNGKYLSACMIDRPLYLLFQFDDLGDPTVGNHVLAKSEGILCIISASLFGNWRLTKDDWICPDSDNFSLDDSYTFFWPLKVGDNLIALRSMGNKNFSSLVVKTRILNG
ncbi:PREDICTED: agglutinin [Prunus dulcis]|uniref:PREDICTED: agglutinin n=1 Tax=Prunus dulcis TaxID=3755 RepID=A0A5E4EXX7_PRUDU|nr:hypothetical protein L3X38_012255 [Prunus dulcis]VVA20556.1 PREDICTED: agglutinin [Prunus dulcis]VVA20594.1 PREDICTED: agglutinin [Prunus dulcis]